MKRILIAEDDKFLASAYKLKLTKTGFEVEIVADGAEAIKRLEETIPDLILLDLVMPKKDGFVTLQEIKANEKWKHIPVIVVSNLGQKEDVDRAAALGATGYIVKTTVTISELVEKVKAVLAKL